MIPDRWEEVLSAALVGTARRPAPPAAELTGADLTRLGAPEAVLLATAGVLATRRRAGRRPEPAGRRPGPEPAAPDPRPACPESAAGVLELILSGELPVPGGVGLLAGHWLDGAARAGSRPPFRLLPRLLELGSGHPELRPRLLDVIGPRGRWLARHHDAWSWATGAGAAGDGDGDGDDGEPAEPVERRFATATRADRVTLLEQIRGAEPDRARDLVASTWGKEPAAARAALLGAFAVGLSDADEPFLDAALDDRAGAVRGTAAELLGRLPESRRAARMTGRLRPLVTAPGRRGRAGLVVARPPAPDAAARRDGITDAAPSGMGVSTWRLIQLVAGTPLPFWTDHLGADPARVVDLAAGGAPEVLVGLEQAVAVQTAGLGGEVVDPGWALALFAARPTATVLAALPTADAAGVLTRFLARTEAHGATVAALLDAVPGPWPEPLGSTVVDRYRRLGGRAAPELATSLPVLAARLDPSTLDLVETWAFGLAGHDTLRRRVQTLGHALSLRAVISREFP